MGLSARCDSRGLRQQSPPCENCSSFWGIQPPKLLYQSCFSKRNDLASNVLHGSGMMNFLTTVWLLRTL